LTSVAFDSKINNAMFGDDAPEKSDITGPEYLELLPATTDQSPSER